MSEISGDIISTAWTKLSINPWRFWATRHASLSVLYRKDVFVRLWQISHIPNVCAEMLLSAVEGHDIVYLILANVGAQQQPY